MNDLDKVKIRFLKNFDLPIIKSVYDYASANNIDMFMLRYVEALKTEKKPNLISSFQFSKNLLDILWMIYVGKRSISHNYESIIRSQITRHISPYIKQNYTRPNISIREVLNTIKNKEDVKILKTFLNIIT